MLSYYQTFYPWMNWSFLQPQSLGMIDLYYYVVIEAGKHAVSEDV